LAEAQQFAQTGVGPDLAQVLERPAAAVQHQHQGDDEAGGSVARAAAGAGQEGVHRLVEFKGAEEFAEQGEPGVGGDGVLGLGELEREHGLFYHDFNLVG
jgi:hypothetical protein